MKLETRNEMQLTAEDKLILAVAKIHPTADEIMVLDALVVEVTDWEKVCNTLIDRGFAPLFYKKIPLLTNAQHIPEAVQQKLKKTYYLTFSRSALMYEQFYAIMNAFAAAGIDVIPLKGIFLVEWLYQDYGLRQMSDIDLLVRKKDAKKALSVLDEIGFNVIDGIESEMLGGLPDLTHFKPRIKNKVMVELHIKVHHNHVKYKLTPENLFKNSIKVSSKEVTFNAMDFYDLLIHLCLHLDKHFYYQHVQFTSFMDIVNILEIHRNDFKWDVLTNKCKEYNCYDIVIKYILISNTYFNVALPAKIVESKDKYLSDSDKKYFIAYLNGVEIEFRKNSIERHLTNLMSKSVFSTITYGFINVFPEPSYMIKRYKIKYPLLVPAYYIYRWWLAIKDLYSVITKK